MWERYFFVFFNFSAILPRFWSFFASQLHFFVFQRTLICWFQRCQTASLWGIAWSRAIYLYWVDCMISLFFDDKGAPVCCYRILSYLISSKYHQTVVDINRCQTDTVVIGEIWSFINNIARIRLSFYSVFLRIRLYFSVYGLKIYGEIEEERSYFIWQYINCIR